MSECPKGKGELPSVAEREGDPRNSVRKKGGNPAIVSDRKGITPETVSERKEGNPRYCPKEKGEHSVRYKMGILATVSK